MIVRVFLKDPDGFYEAAQEAVKDSLSRIDGLSEEERESLVDTRRDVVRDKMKKWVEYGEYVTLEFDLDEMAAKVVERD